MTNAEAVRIVEEVARRKADEFFSEVIAKISAEEPAPEHVEVDGAGEGESRVSSSAWSLPTAPMTGDWEEISRTANETFAWGDGNVDDFSELVRYRGTGDYAGMTLGLGYKDNGEVVGFAFGPGGGSMRGITYFFVADDFAASNEKVSWIRGGGKTGRGGFSPADPVPTVYSGFDLDELGGRVAGKYNQLAVVADAEDAETMLSHTAIQARLRKLP